MTTIRATTRVPASVPDVFSLVSEPQHAVTVIEGLEKLSPIGRQVSGVGARFDAVLRLGPKTVSARIEIVELIEDRRVTWASTGGDNRSITFELREVERATAVRLTISYARAEGMSAILLAPVVEEVVRARARETLARLRELSAAQARG
ncbi:MAG: SRPBCC family protein [Acidimicrobiales bacterium]